MSERLELRDWDEECPNCGSATQIHTSPDTPLGMACDGDEVVCSGECEATLWITCYEDAVIGGDW